MALAKDLNKDNKEGYRKLDKEGKALLLALDTFQANFAFYVLSGMKKATAYRAAGRDIEKSDTASAAACRVLRTVKVKAFIEHVRIKQANEHIGTRQDIIDRYARALDADPRGIYQWSSRRVIEPESERGPGGEGMVWDLTLTNSEDLTLEQAQSVMEMTGGDKPKIKLFTAQMAAESLRKMQGYDAKQGTNTKTPNKIGSDDDKRAALLEVLRVRAESGDHEAAKIYLANTAPSIDEDEDDEDFATALNNSFI